MARKRIQKTTIDEKIVQHLKEIHGFTTRQAWTEYKKRLMFKELPI